MEIDLANNDDFELNGKLLISSLSLLYECSEAATKITSGGRI